MDVRGLISAIRAAGIAVTLNGDRIRYSADSEPGDDTLRLILELRRRKQEAIAVLAKEAAKPGITVANVLAVWPGARILCQEEADELNREMSELSDRCPRCGGAWTDESKPATKTKRAVPLKVCRCETLTKTLH